MSPREMNFKTKLEDIYICHGTDIVLNFEMFFLGEGVAKVYMPILVPVGVIGNVLSFLVGR